MSRPIAAGAEMIDTPRDQIRARALALGSVGGGFCRAVLMVATKMGSKRFLEAGYPGVMGWLPNKADGRRDPIALWPEARSGVVLGLNYGAAENPATLPADRGEISIYARNRDYHDLIKKKLKALGRWMDETFHCGIKVFVDTAPVMEKPLAEAAGIGWQGKHTNLVSRAFGSWLLLGEVFTDLALDADEPESDHCGECRRCLDACPTAAFPAPYRIDARRCISYLTIEHKGPIDRALRPLMGNRIYGCDDCLAVCPWNKFAQVTREEALVARADLTAPRLAELARLDDAGFRAMFSGSSIKRIGRGRFLRNVLMAIANSGDETLLPVAIDKLADDDELVRGAAVWAASRLAAPDHLKKLAASHASQEPSPAVREEWKAAEV